MAKKKNIPLALTIAGSDSGGGAGIQADLKTLAALGVHGTTAVTCITAQNPERVLGIQACRKDVLRQQLDAIFAELPPAAAKTGMLYTAEIIRAVAAFFKRRKKVPLIVDPVMVSTSGAVLLKPAALKALQKELLPCAALVTPNLEEAELLTGKKIESVDDLRTAARFIKKKYRCPALVKGGHLTNLKDAVDIYFDGKTELLLTAPFVKGVSTHGTGCTYSAAITGYLAKGFALPKAVELAKEYITQAIGQAEIAGNQTVLNHFWE